MSDHYTVYVDPDDDDATATFNALAADVTADGATVTAAGTTDSGLDVFHITPASAAEADDA